MRRDRNVRAHVGARRFGISWRPGRAGIVTVVLLVVLVYACIAAMIHVL